MKTIPEMLNPFFTPKRNHYEEVKEFLPESTSIIDDVLFVIARFNHLNTPEFQAELRRVTEREPIIMAEIITQP